MVKKNVKKRKKLKQTQKNIDLENSFFGKEFLLVLIALICALMFLSNIGVAGQFGVMLKNMLYSVMGIVSYIFPFILISLAWISVENKKKIYIPTIVLLLAVCILIESIFTGKGGLIASKIVELLQNTLKTPAFVICIIQGAIIITCLVFITKKPLFSMFAKKTIQVTDRIGRDAYAKAKDASESFSKKIEEAKLEQRLEEIGVKDNIYQNSSNSNDSNDYLSDASTNSINDNNNVDTMFDVNGSNNEQKGIFTNVNPKPDFKFSFFRNDNKPVSESRNILNFNEDIKPKLKEVVEKEKNISQKMNLDDFSNSQIFAQNQQNNDTVIDFTKDVLQNNSNNDDEEEVAVNDVLVSQNDYEEDDNINSFTQRALDNNKEESIEEVTVKKEKQFKEKEIESFANRPVRKHKPYHFPPQSYLTRGGVGSKIDKTYLQEKADILQQTLTEFGVGAKITNVSIGPAIIRFELQPEIGVRVSKITSLEDDLKLALAAKEIRIEAPIPGKQAIGIEIPNSENQTVYLGDLIASKEFKEAKSKLTIALGKDVSGKNVYADIAKMPHILIAGATGSGKSICINSIIMSLIYKADPTQVQLLMIDPKVVELQAYNGIPHLYKPVVTDPMQAKQALNWAVSEMTRRYQKFAEYNVKDLEGYNRVADEKMPQFVIIIDELADLMMAASKEVENAIVRIAQLARACGMHLVIATQRPMATVVTGLIKANVPSRIAFAVSSGLDSRIILDAQGAEKLLGKGDMLFSPIGANQPTRIQGCFVSEEEIERVINTIKEVPLLDDDDEEIVKDDFDNFIAGASGDDSAQDVDELFKECAHLAITTGQASAGNFQRKFKIGFNRAARIIDQLEENGVVGPQEGKKPREVLMSLEEFNAKF